MERPTMQEIPNGKIEHQGDFDYDSLLENGDRFLLHANDEYVYYHDSAVRLEVNFGSEKDCRKVIEFLGNELVRALALVEEEGTV